MLRRWCRRWIPDCPGRSIFAWTLALLCFLKARGLRAETGREASQEGVFSCTLGRGLTMNHGLDADFDKYPYFDEFCSIVDHRDETPPTMRVKFRYDHPGAWQATENMRKSVAVVADMFVRTALEETRCRFLADASLRLFAAPDEDAVLATLCRLLVPTLADGACIVSIRAPSLHCRWVAHADPLKERFVRALGAGLSGEVGKRADWIEQVVRRGRSIELVGQTLTDAFSLISDDFEVSAAISALDIRWLDGLPLTIHNRVLGAAFLFGAPLRQELDVSGKEILQALGHRASLAVENAQFRESARHSIRAREHLMAVASHDLRNSLSLALLSLSSLDIPLDGSSGLSKAARVALLRKGLGRMQRLLDDLLDFASIEAGRLSLSICDAAVSSLVDEAIETFREAAAQKGIELGHRSPDGACSIECDSFRILQVMSNLIGNALKFTPAGGTVTVAAVDRGDDVEFSVADTGCGIASSDLPRVFEAYHRASRSNSGGMGLGLSISKGIIESHGGRVWVESRPGEGTTFYFCLPKHSPVHAKSDGT